MDDRHLDDGAEERALAAQRARKIGWGLLKIYLFGAAVTLIILLTTADHAAGPLIMKILSWPRTLGNIALNL